MSLDLQPSSDLSSATATTITAVSNLPMCQPRANLAGKQSSKEVKRKLNTQAARRYRQRRTEQVESLESDLRNVRQERDELKLRVAKLEGEAELLRTLLVEKH